MDTYFFDAHKGGELLDKYACQHGLQSAGMLGLTNPIEDLMNQGQQFSDKNPHGNNVLHIASFADQVDFLKKIPSEILEKEKDAQNNDYETPLMVAINEFSQDAAKFWIKQDIDMSIIDKDGQDAYDLAERTGQDIICDLISAKDTALTL